MNEYSSLRAKWKERLTGGTAYNPLEPDIAHQISTLTAEAQVIWDKLDKSMQRVSLWSDLASANDSSQLSSGYMRLESMALAYVTKGSPLAGNAALLGDIKRALEWMYTNRYNEHLAPYDNWWDWLIGAPLHLNNIVILLYDQLSPAQIERYMNAVHQFSPEVSATGANRVWLSTVVGIRGVIVEDSVQIEAARDGLSEVFRYAKEGDGFYPDGSFLQHANHPYTGGYGISLLKNIASFMYLLAGSRWAVTDVAGLNVFRWIYESYEPLLYRGAMMDMARGREYVRYYLEDHAAGSQVIQAVMDIAEFAPADDAAAFKRMVKYWIQTDSYRDFFASAPVPMIVKGKIILDDAAIVSRGELIRHKQYPNMDRVVHLRPGFGFALSMYSSRIANYEGDINGDNRKGWYTGSGMTYLYNNDLGQYSGGYWPTVHAYRLPGTTVLQGTPHNSDTLGDSSWTGGAVMEGLYGVSGMALHAYDSKLKAKKSWFMFDDEIVALGAGITSADNRAVETIVENRKLNSRGDNAFTVNGTIKPTTLHVSEWESEIQWAHLEGNVEGSDIGYYFPNGAILKWVRKACTGNWSELTSYPRYSNHTEITNYYLTLWFDHGNHPSDQTYAYVILPNKSSTEVSEYASNPDIVVLHNTSTVQAVKETGLGIVAANFWLDALTWVQDSGGRLFSSNKKSSVMVKETDEAIHVAVSDPTQVNSGRIEIEVNRSAAATLCCDAGVTVVQLSPTVKLTVDVNEAKGKTFVVKFALRIFL